MTSINIALRVGNYQGRGTKASRCVLSIPEDQARSIWGEQSIGSKFLVRNTEGNKWSVTRQQSGLLGYTSYLDSNQWRLTFPTSMTIFHGVIQIDAVAHLNEGTGKEPVLSFRYAPATYRNLPPPIQRIFKSRIESAAGVAASDVIDAAISEVMATDVLDPEPEPDWMTASKELAAIAAAPVPLPFADLKAAIDMLNDQMQLHPYAKLEIDPQGRLHAVVNMVL